MNVGTAGEHVNLTSGNHQRQWWQRHSRWFDPLAKCCSLWFVSDLPHQTKVGRLWAKMRMEKIDQVPCFSWTRDKGPVAQVDVIQPLSFVEQLGDRKIGTLFILLRKWIVEHSLKADLVIFINDFQMFTSSPLFTGFPMHRNELITILVHYTHGWRLFACLLVISSWNVPPKTSAPISMVTDI